MSDRTRELECVIADLKQQVRDAEKERDALRAKIAEMEQQEPVAIQHRVPSVDFRGECVGYSEWKDGKGLEHWPRRTLYSLPGAQPAPSVPREAINKMLTQLMDLAVSNGANSISMPDEYVEVAAWLCGIPAQPAPSMPDGWKLVPIEPTEAMVTAFAELFNVRDQKNTFGPAFRAALAAAPEAKP